MNLQRCKIHDSPLTSLCQSSLGNFTLSSAADDSTIILSTLSNTGAEAPGIKPLKSVPVETTFPITDIVYDFSDNRYFACCYNKTVEYHDLKGTGHIYRSVSGSFINCISTQDNGLIYAGCGNNIEIFDLRTSNPRSSLKLDSENGEVTCINVSSTGGTQYGLSCGTSSGYLEYYDLRNGKKLILDLGYMYGGRKMEINQLIRRMDHVFVMIGEGEGSSKVLQVDYSSCGNEIAREYKISSPEEHSQERYRTQFAVIDDTRILAGDGLIGGNLLLIDGSGKKRAFKVSGDDRDGGVIFSKLGYRDGGDLGVLADNYGYLYSFTSRDLNVDRRADNASP